MEGEWVLADVCEVYSNGEIGLTYVDEPDMPKLRVGHDFYPYLARVVASQ